MVQTTKNAWILMSTFKHGKTEEKSKTSFKEPSKKIAAVRAGDWQEYGRL